MEKLFKGVALVVEHGELVDALADVEVGEVHEAHGHTFLPENGMAHAAGGLDCGRASLHDSYAVDKNSRVVKVVRKDFGRGRGHA